MSGWLALQLLLVSTSPAVDAADSVNSLPIDSSQRHPHRAPLPQRSAEPRTSGSSTYAQRLQTHKKAERLLAEVPAGVREERAEARELLRVQRWALRRTHLPRPRKQNLDPTAESHAITNDHHHMNQNLADPPHHSSGRSHKNHRERDGSDLDTGGGTRGGGGGTGAGRWDRGSAAKRRISHRSQLIFRPKSLLFLSFLVLMSQNTLRKLQNI